MQVLEQLRAARRQTALVVDEYGDVVGLVSLTDVLEAIVGALPPQGGEEDAEAVLREDGTWLIDGRMDLHEFKQRFRIDALPGEESAEVNTVGGLVMLALGRVPRVTDTVEVAGLRVEVVDMDRHRVDKVLVKALEDTAGASERGAASS
jgi:putative hemolysin